MSNSAGSAAPMLLGILYDFPQADHGAAFEEAVRVGLDTVSATGRLDRAVEFVARQSAGLPAGTAHDVTKTFGELVDAGVLAVIGPSISDNGLIVGPLADAVGVPCINYTGGERTRSEFMFHYQVGSLEEEPSALAAYLLEESRSKVAVVYDRSPVGRRYFEFFGEACESAGIDIVANAPIAPLVEDLSGPVARLRDAEPEALAYLGLGVGARALALGLAEHDWSVPVVANSALMFGYAQRDWRAGWEGWVYLDSVSDHNVARQALKARSARSAAGPIGVAAYDIGRLLAEGLARCTHLTRHGVKEALERVKGLPAASGLEGTTMGFGNFDHGALKGRYLVRRCWRDGKTVEIDPG
jgi:branched-chain amino acid transport system substrate-binding protein